VIGTIFEAEIVIDTKQAKRRPLAFTRVGVENPAAGNLAAGLSLWDWQAADNFLVGYFVSNILIKLLFFFFYFEIFLTARQLVKILDLYQR
jgi:hypothetical protein